MGVRKNNKNNKKKVGRGVLNGLINKLPFEMHMPGGYRYCGPGTDLKERLARGDEGINALDAACKEHDMVYEQNQDDMEVRKAADRELARRAAEIAADDNSDAKKTAFFVKKAMDVKTASEFDPITELTGIKPSLLRTIVTTAVGSALGIGPVAQLAMNLAPVIATLFSGITISGKGLKMKKRSTKKKRLTRRK